MEVRTTCLLLLFLLLLPRLHPKIAQAFFSLFFSLLFSFFFLFDSVIRCVKLRALFRGGGDGGGGGGGGGGGVEAWGAARLTFYKCQGLPAVACHEYARTTKMAR